MKCKMLFLLLGLLLSNITFASARKTKGSVVSIKEHWLEKDDRSIFFAPIITQCGNLIQIYSDIDFPNFQICVKDTSGHIIYLDTVFISANQPYSFVLPEVKENDCVMIDLILGEMFLFGSLL